MEIGNELMHQNLKDESKISILLGDGSKLLKKARPSKY
jgi:hypothetical protein